MLTVEIHGMEKGEDVLRGTIRWDGKTLSAEPDNSIALQGILSAPVRQPGTGKVLKPDAEPEEWLKCLCCTYRNVYLRATEAKGDAPGNETRRVITPPDCPGNPDVN